MGRLRDLSSAAFVVALRRLQGRGAYSTLDTAIREKELGVVADVAAFVAGRVDAVAAELTPQNADDLLAEWEAWFRLSNDAARTPTERRSRLAAIRARAPGVTAPLIKAGMRRSAGRHPLRRGSRARRS